MYDELIINFYSFSLLLSVANCGSKSDSYWYQHLFFGQQEFEFQIWLTAWYYILIAGWAGPAPDWLSGAGVLIRNASPALRGKSHPLTWGTVRISVQYVQSRP